MLKIQESMLKIQESTLKIQKSTLKIQKSTLKIQKSTLEARSRRQDAKLGTFRIKSLDAPSATSVAETLMQVDVDILPQTPRSDSPTRRSAVMLKEHFRRWISKIDPQLVGPLDSKTVRAPVKDPDGRKLTWTKLTDNVVSKILQSDPDSPPFDENDCWMVKQARGDTSGYIVRKFSDGGESNKQQLHRVLYMLKNPGEKARLEKETGKLVLAHLCGRGRHDTKKGIDQCCINPFHLSAESQQRNLDRDRCRRSVAKLCPHRVKCVYTSRKGRKRQCRSNKDAIEYPCTCGHGCYEEEEEGEGEEEDDGDDDEDEDEGEEE